MRRNALKAFAFLMLGLVFACSKGEEAAANSPAAAASAGEIVTPPFAVSGDLHGLMLVWFDQAGPHIAATRDEIPAPHRDRVRVDSLSLSPEQRLDPNFVYLADVRAPGPNGAYVVRKVAREHFDAIIDEAAQQAAAVVANAPTDPNASVIIYGASWCGACHQAADFLRTNHIAFVEKDIERDPAARTEMQTKCDAAGLHPNGIPVIDFQGHIVLGFDPNELQRLILRMPPPAPATPAPTPGVPSPVAPPNVHVT